MKSGSRRFNGQHSGLKHAALCARLARRRIFCLLEESGLVEKGESTDMQRSFDIRLSPSG